LFFSIRAADDLLQISVSAQRAQNRKKIKRNKKSVSSVNPSRNHRCRQNESPKRGAKRHIANRISFISSTMSTFACSTIEIGPKQSAPKRGVQATGAAPSNSLTENGGKISCTLLLPLWRPL
jgi:hypothetical protein